MLLTILTLRKDAQGRLRVGAGVGVGADSVRRVKALVEAGVDIIAVDSAQWTF